MKNKKKTINDFGKIKLQNSLFNIHVSFFLSHKYKVLNLINYK